MRGVWAAKAVVQKSISVLPRAQRVNRRFQQVTGRLGLSAEVVLQRLEWAGRHLTTFDELRGHAAEARPSGFRALELGSGWHPFVPLTLVLGGADEVLMCDLEDLSDTDLFAETVDAVLEAAESGLLDALVPGVRPDRIDRLADVRSTLDRVGRLVAFDDLGIRLASGDVRDLTPDGPPDLIVSNTVLEHIPPDVLVGILGAFREMSVPDTVMSHLVDMCDHYLYIDGSLTPYHFLRFSERQWRWVDNSIQPMNRLRIQQYRELYAQAEVAITRERLGGGVPEDLAGLPLAPPFDAMEPTDVAIKSAWFDTRF